MLRSSKILTSSLNDEIVRSKHPLMLVPLQKKDKEERRDQLKKNQEQEDLEFDYVGFERDICSRKNAIVQEKTLVA